MDSSALTRLRVLKVIRRLGPISRTELAEIADLSAATITEVTGDLAARRLIVEQRQKGNGTGRPRMLLTVNADATVVIGAGVTARAQLAASFVDLAGHSLHSAEAPLSSHQRLRGHADEIAELLARMIAEGPVPASRISTVALAMPAVIDSRKGAVHWMPTFPPESTPVADIIGAKLNLPVTIENDVDCLARAEHWFGDGAQRDDFTLVYTGLLVGLAQYVGGMPRLGANGFNPQFGHVKTNVGAGARLCVCGARGCLTAHGSIGRFLLGPDERFDLRKHAVEDFPSLFRGFIQAATDGDPALRATFEEVGAHLGIALANYINTTDPGEVIVRTSDPGMPPLIAGALNKSLAAHTLPVLLSRTRVSVTPALQDWRRKGAVALALEQTYLGEPGDPRPIRRSRARKNPDREPSYALTLGAD